MGCNFVAKARQLHFLTSAFHEAGRHEQLLSRQQVWQRDPWYMQGGRISESSLHLVLPNLTLGRCQGLWQQGLSLPYMRRRRGDLCKQIQAGMQYSKLGLTQLKVSKVCLGDSQLHVSFMAIEYVVCCMCDCRPSDEFDIVPLQMALLVRS
jgi:hypothetical protein